MLNLSMLNRLDDTVLERPSELLSNVAFKTNFHVQDLLKPF